jgi:phosphate transport system substrate-binding protein
MTTTLKVFALAMTALAAVGCGKQAGKRDAATAPQAPAPAATPQNGGEIRVVGSSTVYPFAAKVAQELKSRSGFNVVVESTGSGGGHKLFCEGVGPNTADVTNSSRRQKKGEFDTCAANGVTDIVEVKIGYDGIVLANALAAPDFSISLKQLYLALAKDIPTSDADCTMKPNPHQNWSDIDPALPDEAIEAYGPPPTSGTRDAFVEIAMDGGAKDIPCLADLKKSDEKAFERAARTLREDGRWIDSGENDNAIVQTLANTPTAIGVFGYSFLEENTDKVKAATVGGVAPTLEKIASGEYPVSRSLFFYLKKANVAGKDGLKDYAREFLSVEAAGEGGYLEEIGLIPLAEDERAKQLETIESLTTYQQ